MSDAIDPSLMRDFVTEAGELIEQLDSDLVALETAADGNEAADLLNSIFRALHTVKGAAGFLNLGKVTVFAHAAEDALNHLRKQKQTVGAQVIDVLLASADLLRQMVEALASGEEPPAAEQALLDRLHAVAADGGDADDSTRPGDPAPPQGQPPAPAEAPGADSGRMPLNLPEQKQDLLNFMTADLRESVQQMRQAIAEGAAAAQRTDAGSQLWELTASLDRTAEFFELQALSTVIQIAQQAGAGLAEASDDNAIQLLVRLSAMATLIEQQAEALDQGQALTWPLDTLAQRIQTLADGGPLPAEAQVTSDDVETVLVVDGIKEDRRSAASDAAYAGPERRGTPRAEQTIRVEVSRLESLLNLVGRMVLAKNRVLSISRKIQTQNVAQELAEQVTAAANELDRLTDNLQVSVMQTRLQPMSKLVDRYPRVIRDIARSTGKKINLQVVGRETEVDKSVLELLADPLVHILRNAADHGIELPPQRAAAGKDETGTIHLAAEHQGGHVRIVVEDDGKGIDAKIIGQRAIERELTSPEQLASMSEQEIFKFIFAAGFSTAEKITDLSGRGVGMDVVRNNVEKMNGSIHVNSVVGQGSTIEILIPLTVAIMPAMVVGVGAQLYCVPLQSVVQIIRPDPAAMHIVDQQPVVQLRDGVLPILDLHRAFGQPCPKRQPFAMVVAAGGDRAGLLVDRLIGQQDIVIKPLEEDYAGQGPFSGATILEDGDASLILDVVKLLREPNPNLNTQHQTRETAAAA